MSLIEMMMPQMGESVMEATIVSWLKKEGDSIEKDESILEIATDKVDTEVPSLHKGVIKEILAKEGAVVQIGKPIAIIDAEVENGEYYPAAREANGVGSMQSNSSTQSTHNSDTIVAVKKSSTPDKPSTNGTTSGENGHTKRKGDRFYSPLVRNIANKETVSFEELDNINGTGKDGRVTKKDVIDYIEHRKTPKFNSALGEMENFKTTPGYQINIAPGDEIIEMSRMRRIIADRMLDSLNSAALVTSFNEVDVTNVVNWRNKVKNEFRRSEGGPFTFTPIFIEAVVNALKDYPMVNALVEGYKIIKKKDINVGMAVALPDGNLLVPVIKNADQLSLTGLARKVNDLAFRARENQLSPDELKEGTFAVSNIGVVGSIAGTPILIRPQVGVLAIGSIVKKPAVLETEHGDVIAIRHKMYLCHTYDHRVIDGALGGLFAKRVAEYLEAFDMNRTL